MMMIDYSRISEGLLLLSEQAWTQTLLLAAALLRGIISHFPSLQFGDLEPLVFL